MSKRSNSSAPAGRRVETVAGFLLVQNLDSIIEMLIKHNFEVTVLPLSDVMQQEHAFSSCVKLF